MTRGELYRVHRPGGDPKEYRIYAVVSRQTVIESKFSTVICAMVFSKGAGLSTQVAIGLEEGLKHQSWIFCDNLMSLQKARLTHYVGSLSAITLAELNRALRIALEI